MVPCSDRFLRRARAERALALLAPVALVAGACRTAEPPPLVAPPIEIEATHYRGTPLGGPDPVDEDADHRSRDADVRSRDADVRSRDVDVRSQDAYSATADLWFLERVPSITLPPLSNRTRLVVDVEGDRTIRSVPGLGSRAMLAGGDRGRAFLERLAAGDLGRSVLVTSVDLALPRSVTAELEATGPFPVRAASGLEQRSFGLLLHRDERDVLSVVIELERLGGDEPMHELIVLEDAPSVDGAPLALVLAAPFGSGGAIVARLAVTSAPPDGTTAHERHAAALARCLEDLQTPPSLVPERLRRAAEPEGTSEPVRATDAAGVDGRRAALAIVAQASDAPVCRDLVLVADSELLDAFVERLAAPDPQAGDVTWRIERNAYALLAERLLEGDVEPELRAVALRHAGEVGRYPDQLRRFLEASDDRSVFTELLVSENRSFLPALGPASRARACAWLAERGLAPAGFDPLASADERRAALRDYARTLTGAGTGSASDTVRDGGAR